MPLKKTFLKLAVLGVFLALVIVGIKYKTTSLSVNRNPLINLNDSINNPGIGGYYFVGSSRTQMAINPEIVKSYFPGKEVVNYGISSSTFLTNCIMTDFLIQTKHPEIVFFELCPVNEVIPEELFKISKASGLNVFSSLNSLLHNTSSLEKLKINLKFLNYFLKDKIIMKQDIKKIINPKTPEMPCMIGTIDSIGNYCSSASSFIKHDDLLTTPKQETSLSLYTTVIENLCKLASKNNVRLVFYLPVTFKNPKETDINIPLFNSLPANSKIEYSKEFIEEIAQSKYLFNANHFNTEGAEKFSNLFSPLMAEHLRKYEPGFTSPE